jgi:hypothetical protein
MDLISYSGEGGRRLLCWVPLKELTSINVPDYLFRWGRETPTLLGPFERANPNHWTWLPLQESGERHLLPNLNQCTWLPLLESGERQLLPNLNHWTYYLFRWAERDTYSLTSINVPDYLFRWAERDTYSLTSINVPDYLFRWAERETPTP